MCTEQADATRILSAHDYARRMETYAREGIARASCIGNRGPVRFDERGKVHPDIVDDYWKHGFPEIPAHLEDLRSGDHPDSFNGPPAGTPMERAAAPAFRHYADRWLARESGRWAAGTLRVNRGKLRNQILPAIGDVPVNELRPADLADIVNAAKSRSVRNQLVGALRGPLEIACAEDVIAESLYGAKLRALLDKRDYAVAHRAAMAFADAPGFLQGLGDSRPELALKLVMLTGCRIHAVSGGSAGEVSGDIWEVPEARQPKGKHTPRTPLSGAALACLGGFGVSPDDIRRAVNGAGVTVHGFRSTFRDWCAAEGVSRDLAELCLGHKAAGAVESAYWRSDMLGERREVMRRWADYLTGTAPGSA